MKTDNRPKARAAKRDLREHVLSAIEPAHVFDGFCGSGEMYRAAWSRAASYTGCDLKWSIKDERRRFAGDVNKVLRAIDLAPFNVFDFDAYGSPWQAMIILAARRTWAAGERGAVVLTDGSSMKLRFGGAVAAMMELTGVRRMPPKADAARALQQAAMRAWLRRVRVRLLQSWQAESASSGVGAQAMTYTAVVFEGLGDAS